MQSTTKPYAVLGAGSWGTGLAIQLSRLGHAVLLWSHGDAHHRAMVASGSNEKHLSGIAFPAGLTPTRDLRATLAAAGDVIVVVPSQAFRPLLQRLAGVLSPGQRIAWGTKGLELGSGLLLHQIAAEELGPGWPVAVVSGPTFAREVALELPSALVVASACPLFAAELAQALSGRQLLTFTSADVVGVEIGGAAKNVIAIAAGVAEGLGFGANAQAALITAGLDEVVRLGLALGAEHATLVGLAGLGDLLLSCSDDQSRNRRFGVALGQGRNVARARAAVGQVVEGADTAATLHALAAARQVSMPIAEQVYQLVHAGLSPGDAARRLMAAARRQ